AVHRLRLDRVGGGGATGVVLPGSGAMIGATARGAFLGRRWAGGPGVATQLLHLPVAWSFRGGVTDWVFWVLAGLALVTLVCLVVRSSTGHFLAEEPRPEDPGNGPEGKDSL